MASSYNLQKPLTALTALQNRFALLDLSGEIRVVSRHQVDEVMNGGSGEISFYKRNEGQILIARELENLPFATKPNDEFKMFLANPNTHVYKAVAFSPLKTPPTTLNYWVEPSIQAKKGDWFVLQEFLHTVICDNDVALFDYLIRYLAHMLQKPEDKPGIMIVLLSGQGTGEIVLSF